MKLAVLDPLLLSKLYSVVRRNDIDLIYAHHYEALIAALIVRSLKPYPVIYDAHTLLETELPDYVTSPMKPFMRLIGRWFDRHVPRRANRIVAVSREIAEKLSANSTNGSTVSVIGNGLELDHFMACRWDPKPRDGKRSIAIFTGNLAGYQGIELMLQAFALLRQRRDDILLRIVTDDDFGRYASLVRELGIEQDLEVARADFASLPRELASASVAINPRLAMDGVPQKLLNYMAVGVPIVSFAGSARNLKNNENGLIVPDGDTRALADAIDVLLNDRETAIRIGRAARCDAERAGTWLNAGRKIEEVFAGLFE
jgi:glycosyltransferase involved in cell wall biosynthesis